MTDTSPAVVNPFTRDPSRMRRNTRGSRWVTFGGTVKKQRAVPVKRPQIIHRPSVAESHAASFTESLSSESRNGKGRKNSDASVYSYRQQATIYNVNEIPDANIHPAGFSSYGRDSLYYDDDIEVPSRSRTSLVSPDTRPRRRPRSMSLPNTPFVLPETAKVSPLSTSLSYRMDSPVSEIVDIGWAQFRDGNGDERSPEDRSAATAFPRFSYTIPTLSQKPSKKERSKNKTKEEKTCLTFNPPALSPGPYLAGTKKPGNPTATKPATSFTDLYRSAKQIYSLGPKGEGQKVWRSIQTLREQKRQFRRRQALEVIQEERKQAQEKQLQDTHVAALNYVKSPLLSVRASVTSPSPTRPAPAEPLGVGRRVVPKAERADVTSVKSDEGNGREGVQEVKGESNSASSPSELSVPVGASASVQNDAQEVVIDRSKPLPRVPKLDPAPRSRGQGKVAGKGKLGLPPPPMALGPKKSEKIGNPTAPRREKGLPPPPVPRSLRPIPPVGTPTPVPASQAKLERFAGLDDQQTERPGFKRREKKGKKNQDHAWLVRALGSIFDVEVPADPSSQRTHTNRTTTRKQERLKASISRPYATRCPGGSTANFAKESGGVGGPFAAISLPPGVHCKSELQRYNERKGKEKANAKKHMPPPPPPPPPPPLVLPHRQEQNESSTEAKAKKEHSRGWFDWLPSHEGGSKSFYTGFNKSDQSLGGRKRADSDDSFTCQGIDAIGQHDFAYTNADGACQADRTRAPPAHYQNPGPSYQSGPRIYVSDQDASLVPQPLFSGGEEDVATMYVKAVPEMTIRDTRFYAPYDAVLSEYIR